MAQLVSGEPPASTQESDLSHSKGSAVHGISTLHGVPGNRFAETPPSWADSTDDYSQPVVTKEAQMLGKHPTLQARKELSF